MGPVTVNDRNTAIQRRGIPVPHASSAIVVASCLVFLSLRLSSPPYPGVQYDEALVYGPDLLGRFRQYGYPVCRSHMRYRDAEFRFKILSRCAKAVMFGYVQLISTWNT
jgi:hypothetical protein